MKHKCHSKENHIKKCTSKTTIKIPQAPPQPHQVSTEKEKNGEMISHLKTLLKPHNRIPGEGKSNSNSLNHSRTLHDFKGSTYLKNNVCTEMVTSNNWKKKTLGVDLNKTNKKSQSKSKKQILKERISFEGKPFKKAKKNKDKSLGGGKSAVFINWNLDQDIAETRKSIQREVRKSSSKPKIQKKELLKITKSYEKLLNKVIDHSKNFCISPLKKPIENKQSSQSMSQSDSVCTVRQLQPQTLHTQKKLAGPTLQLQNVRNLGIMDYNDEFMSHYDELSLSWKREIEAQRRF